MKIPVLHLEDGFHQFSFNIPAGTLQFSGSEVYPEDLIANVEISKYEKNIKCRVDVKTLGHYTCDRCLDQFVAPHHQFFELLFHIGTADFETDEEDVVFIKAETVEINLVEWLVEYLILTIPMKNICKKGCKGICPGCGAELNHEYCTCPVSAGDPRWEKLKDLIK
jgi:uncharacterized protein